MTYGAKPSTLQAVPAGTGDAVPAAFKGVPPATDLVTPTGTIGSVSDPGSNGDQQRANWMAVLNLSEEQIQAAVFQHLNRRRAKGVIAWHPKNGGIHQATARQRMVNAQQGVLPGIPDVQLFKGGQLYCLELKTLKGRLTPEQQSLGHLFREQGAITGCAYGLIEALAWLERHGLLEGRTV